MKQCVHFRLHMVPATWNQSVSSDTDGTNGYSAPTGGPIETGRDLAGKKPPPDGSASSGNASGGAGRTARGEALDVQEAIESGRERSKAPAFLVENGAGQGLELERRKGGRPKE